MRLDKAVEILTAIIQTGDYQGDPDDSDAVKLGAEALKRVELHRTDRRYPWHTPLPSETKD